MANISIQPVTIWNNGENKIEGFLTSKGLFVDREQAAKIAYNTGQISNKILSLYFLTF